MMKTALAALAALVSSLAFCDTPGDRPEASVKLEDIRDFNTRVVTNAWMAVEASVSSVVSESVSAATGAIRRVDGPARPLPEYLHVLDFDDTYPDAAAGYYLSRGNGKTDGGCSAVSRGGLVFRNFDFPFDARAEFVVRLGAGAGRFASVGVAQVGTNLTEEIVTSGKPNRWYKALPGATVDGINENGVVCEINVVDTPVTGWRTTGDIHPLAAVRWALDNGKSAEDAATNLASRVAFPAGWAQNFHWMLADERETWIVENGKASNVTAVAAKRVMTNFQILPDTYSGMGSERYAVLRGGASVTNAWYTRAYAPDTEWASEFGSVEEMASAKSAWASHDKEDLRGKGLWQTVHTSVYDITNRVLRIAVQETGDWYAFALKTGGGKVDWSKVENTPTTLSGYGITDGATKAEMESGLSATNDFLRSSGGTVTGNVTLQNESGTKSPELVFESNGIRVPLYAQEGQLTAPEMRVRDYLAVNGTASFVGISEFDSRASFYDTVYINGTVYLNGVVSSEYSHNLHDYGIIDARALTNNVCAADSLSEWTFGGGAAGMTGLAVRYNSNAGYYSLMSGSQILAETYDGYSQRELAVEFTNYSPGAFDSPPTATRSVVTVSNDIFVTWVPMTNAVARAVSANNPAFSNAVLAVGLNIGTNDVAAIGAMVDILHDFPVDPATGATTLGGLLVALAAAVAGLRKKTQLLKSDGTAEDTFATDLLGKPVAITAVQDIVNDMFDDGDTTVYPRTTGEG